MSHGNSIAGRGLHHRCAAEDRPSTTHRIARRTGIVASGFHPTDSPPQKSKPLESTDHQGLLSSLPSQPLGAPSPRTSHHHPAAIHRNARPPSPPQSSDPNRTRSPRSPEPESLAKPRSRSSFRALGLRCRPLRLRPSPAVRRGRRGGLRRTSPIEDERPRAPPPIVARNGRAGDTLAPRQLTFNSPPRPSRPRRATPRTISSPRDTRRNCTASR